MKQFEHNGQRVRVFEPNEYSPGHAYLDYDYGDTFRYERYGEQVPCKGYRKTTRWDFCLGSDVPGSSLRIENEMVICDGLDAAEIIFKFRPPHPHPEIVEFYERTIAK